MQPFLLVKLPEFVFDSLLSMQTHADRLLANVAETVFAGSLRSHSIHLIVTSQTRLTLTAILAHAQTVRCSA